MSLLADFLGNDVTVGDATIHLWGDLDRQALLQARVRPGIATLDAARRILQSVPSALAHEAFLARPLARNGQHAEALRVRLDALGFTPRWDPFQSSVLLCGVAHSLLALDRAEEALVVAREAHRHAPLDPYAMRAWADAARQTGAANDAAAVVLWLRDAGYGEPIVDRAPLKEEGTAVPAPLSISELAPLSDDDTARYLVMKEVDEGFDCKRRKRVRHAMALMRRGELGLARNTAADDDGDSGGMTTLDGWLNLGVPDEIAWTAKRTVVSVLDQTPDGARARAGARSNEPNRYWDVSGIGYRNRLVKVAGPEDLEALLFCPDRVAFVESLSRLSKHPVTIRFNALRREISRQFPNAGALQFNLGTTGPLGTDGNPVSFYIHGQSRDRSEFPTRFERMADRRGRCKSCKQPIEKGSLALSSGRMSIEGEPKFTRLHLACALDQPKRHEDLRQALEREPRQLPELTNVAERLQDGAMRTGTAP